MDIKTLQSELETLKKFYKDFTATKLDFTAGTIKDVRLKVLNRMNEIELDIIQAENDTEVKP